MRHDLELAYLGLEVAEPDPLNDFFGDIIGLTAGAPTASGARTWRNDAKAQRLVIQEGPLNDAAFLGFAADGVATFDRLTTQLAAAGFALTAATDTELAERGVAAMQHTMSPWGVRFELVHGLAETDEPLDRAAMPGGFLTEHVGFGHTVFATNALDQSHRFLTEGLGWGQSDWIVLPLGPDMELEVRFYHCNERHHTIALAHVPFEVPQKLHHVMFETNDRNDVGRAFDRAFAAKLPLPNGLGQHDNDAMFSFYVVSPAGFQVEVGYGARLITDDWDDNRQYDRISLWGHQPVTHA